MKPRRIGIGFEQGLGKLSHEFNESINVREGERDQARVLVRVLIEDFNGVGVGKGWLLHSIWKRGGKDVGGCSLKWDCLLGCGLQRRESE